MRSRSDRIFAAIPDAVDVVLVMNGSANFTDSTFKYVSGVTRGGYEGCSAVLRSGASRATNTQGLRRETPTICTRSTWSGRAI